jgi:hypothetical protein
MRARLNFSTCVIHVTKNKRKEMKITEIIQRKPPRKKIKKIKERESKRGRRRTC